MAAAGYAVAYQEHYQPSAAKHVSVTDYASASSIGHTIRWLHGTLEHRMPGYVCNYSTS